MSSKNETKAVVNLIIAHIVTVWKAVKSTFHEGSPENKEAAFFLNNIPK
jgi:hypothetical protein